MRDGYFRLTQGLEVQLNELSMIGESATEILIFDGLAVEQQALDGNHLYYYPEKQRELKEREERAIEKVRAELRNIRDNRSVIDIWAEGE